MSADELPHIDEHVTIVAAAPDRVWAELGAVLGAANPPGSRAVGQALRVQPLDPSGDPLGRGSSLRGFRVARSQPVVELALEGEHRFSRYALIFRMDALGPDRVRLRAETRAAFPGPSGRVYRALVIGTRGHVLVVRRLLRAVKGRSER